MRWIYDKKLQKLVEVTVAKSPPVHSVMTDLPAYKSPLGTGVIEGRYARREDMKRGDCREVDPSERIDPTPKSKAQATRERTQLDARRGHKIDPRTFDRLMRN